MNKTNDKVKLFAALLVIGILATLNMWQYRAGLAEEEASNVLEDTGLEQGASNAFAHDRPALQPAKQQAGIDDHSPLVGTLEGLGRRETIDPVNPKEDYETLLEADLRDSLQRSQKENDELREKAYFAELLKSDSQTTDSQRASLLLGEMTYSTRAVESVNLETRLCLRGSSNLSDEDILWMGDCAESGVWPVTDKFGEPEVQLSIAKKFGPKRLSEELEMVSLWNLIHEASSPEGVVEVWGENLATVYRRLPPSKRVWMKCTFADTLLSAGVDL